jgi:hypothetical protein
MQTLFVDQLSAFEKLRQFKVGALFMEPGTGKTRTAYELINSVKGIDYILYLAPCQVIRTTNPEESVVAEIEKCGGFNVEHDFIGIESISSSDRIYLQLISKVSRHSSFIICDESLKIKNWDAKRTKRIVHLGTLTEYKLVLNGTPLSRNVLDLWAQFEFLSPKILDMSLAEYKSTFVKYTTITKKINGIKNTKEIIDGYENIDYLYSIIKHYIYECDLKLEVGQSFFEYFYDLDEDITEEYNRIKEFMLNNEYLMFRNNNIFLEMIQQMQHAYCCSSEKFALINRIMDHEWEDKTVIFCKYISSKEQLQKLFPNIRVLTYGKNAYGLNLQKYNATIFFDKTLDFALRLQAMRRTYRRGQQTNCTFYDLTGRCGLEKLIDNNIIRKQSMLNYFKMVSHSQLINAL